jgi:ribosomal protein S18 acetylase RimI-like enzyme
MIATLSDWDTEVFGYKVGILRLNSYRFNYDIRKANVEHFDVVFVKADFWMEPDGQVRALDYLYDMELDERAARHPNKLTSVITSNVSHLKIAKTAFQDSRFLSDIRLGEMVPDMYEKWLARKPVHVLDGAEDDAFLFETKDEDGARRISLVAVKDSSRGYGIGRLLVSSVIRNRDSEAFRVKVSCKNHRAVRFYESLGFRVKSVHTAFHVWTLP